MSGILVTQSFGNENEYRRAILMIWSFWVHAATSAKVVLFTDRPDYFESYFFGQPVEYILLTPEMIKSMRGDIDFLHRMKISMIEEAFGRSKNNLLYADSDTFFISDPSPLLENLSPEVAYMHTREYDFESIRNMRLPAGKAFQEFVNLLDKKTFVLADESSLKVPTSLSSWNAGVMMFHPTHKKLLPDIYALTDQFYPATLNHASEQYAFSIVLQNKTELRSCEEVIYHYWCRVKKQIADDFLFKNVSQLVHANSTQKIITIKKWTSYLIWTFDNHEWILRDRSIQAFHENKFKDGYRFAIKAILKNPLNFAFIKDMAYHTKRLVTTEIDKERFSGKV